MRHPQDDQGGQERRRPDRVVQERLAAAPDRKERISPAVLQQQPGQREPEREEGQPGSAAEHGGDHQHAGAGHEAHDAAVPVQSLTARRQAGRSVALNLTNSGSVARPREALSANE